MLTDTRTCVIFNMSRHPDAYCSSWNGSDASMDPEDITQLKRNRNSLLNISCQMSTGEMRESLEEGSRGIVTGASPTNGGKDAVAMDTDDVGRGKRERVH